MSLQHVSILLFVVSVILTTLSTLFTYTYVHTHNICYEMAIAETHRTNVSRSKQCEKKVRNTRRKIVESGENKRVQSAYKSHNKSTLFIVLVVHDWCITMLYTKHIYSFASSIFLRFLFLPIDSYINTFYSVLHFPP